MGRGPTGPQTKSLWPQYDATPPTILAVITGGSAKANGWRNVPTTLSWSVNDSQSPVNVKKNCDPVVVENAAGASYRCMAASNGGFKSATVRLYVDTIAPVSNVSSPQQTTYNQSTPLTASWSSFDSLSGVLSTVALLDGNPVAQGQPIDPAVGEHTFTVAATDLAGNSAGSSFTFTIAETGDFPIPPAFTSTPPLTVSVGSQYGYAITTSDLDEVPANHHCDGEAGLPDLCEQRQRHGLTRRHPLCCQPRCT